MLKNRILAEKPQEEELKSRLKAAREKLAVQQMKIKEHKLPVLVLLEGWGTSGKGSVIGQVIRNIDPRFFKVASMAPAIIVIKLVALVRYKFLAVVACTAAK